MPEAAQTTIEDLKQQYDEEGTRSGVGNVYEGIAEDANFNGPIDVFSDIRALRDGETNPHAMDYVRNNLKTELFEAVMPFKKSKIEMGIVERDGGIDLEMGGFSVRAMLENGIAHEEQNLIDQGIDIWKQMEEQTEDEHEKMFELRRRRQEYVNFAFMLDNLHRMEKGEAFVELSPYPQGVDRRLSHPYGYSNNNAVTRILTMQEVEGRNVIICEQVKHPTNVEAMKRLAAVQKLEFEGKDLIDSNMDDGVELLAQSGFVTLRPEEGGATNLDELLDIYYEGTDELGTEKYKAFYARAEELATTKIEELIATMKEISDKYVIESPDDRETATRGIVRAKMQFWLDFVKDIKKDKKLALEVGIEDADGTIGAKILIETLSEMSVCGTGITMDQIAMEMLNPGAQILRLMGVVDLDDDHGTKATNCPKCGMILTREGLTNGLIPKCPNVKCQDGTIGCKVGDNFSWIALREKYTMRKAA